jgi:hypothetical protein
MDALIIVLLKSLAAQGTPWILFVLSILACFYLLRELRSAERACGDRQFEAERSREQLHEKRVEEARQAISALNATAASNADLALAVKDRTAVLEKLDGDVREMRDSIIELCAVVKAKV